MKRSFSIEQQHSLPAGLQRALNTLPGEKDLSADAVSRAAQRGYREREKILAAEKKKEVAAMLAALTPEMKSAMKFHAIQRTQEAADGEKIHHVGSSAVLPDVLHHRALRRD